MVVGNDASLRPASRHGRGVVTVVPITSNATVRGRMHVLGADLRTEFVEATNRQIRWLVTFATAWTTVLLTLARLVS